MQALASLAARGNLGRLRTRVVASLAVVVMPMIVGHGAAEGGASDLPALLKVSVASGPALPLGKAAERWAALIAEDTAHGLSTELHPGASLADRDPAREVEALKAGNADLAVGSALQWSLQLPALGVYALPWLATSDRALEALAADAGLSGAIAQRLGDQGLVLVNVAPLGHRAIATTTRAIRAPEDVRALRLRTAALPLVHELLLALGALPQAMPFAQARAALGKGELDGQVGTPASLATARAAASGLKHVTDWAAVADMMVFVVRKPVWQALTDVQRDAVRRHAGAAVAQAQALVRQREALHTLARNGVSVVRITPAGHDAFRAAAQPVIARWREAVGAELATMAERVVADVQAAEPKRP
jgi:TRAP-type C4-dicarboxylate transport system substrate-binding protein